MPLDIRSGLAALLLAACQPAGPAPAAAPAPTDAPAARDIATAASPDALRAEVWRMLEVLAADSLEGRRTATRGEQRAANFIAGEMRRIGLSPAGDTGYVQLVPLTLHRLADGRERLQLRGGSDIVPADRRREGRNVIGMIVGTDPVLRDEAVVVGAHFDHLGIGRPVDGDSIYNGADDDASGVVAVLGIAQALAAGTPPRRTVIFAAFTGEEQGLLGTRWYLEHPPVPIARTVVNLQVEMIGRPDSLAGGTGRAWLTGFERSTLGDILRAGGIPIVADPRPDQRFFERSDNIAFARRGIPAHTLSSFNLHADYHRPSDELERVDLTHMTDVIRAAAGAVRLLADGPAPVWHPGGQPAAE